MTVIPSLPFVRPALAALLFVLGAAAPGVGRAQSRGELLYGTHCLACHSTQMHWREKKQVVDWPSLRAQVRRWQAADHLAWGDDDIEAVAQYLDALYYHLPPPSPRAVVSARP